MRREERGEEMRGDHERRSRAGRAGHDDERTEWYLSNGGME